MKNLIVLFLLILPIASAAGVSNIGNASIAPTGAQIETQSNDELDPNDCSRGIDESNQENCDAEMQS